MIVTLLDLVLFTTYFLLLFLSIFWILVLFSKDSKKEQETTMKNQPFFSTIVPAFNEEKSIKGTLTSLINLDYPQEKMEIVVVNDGSTDNTQAIVENFIREHPDFNIRLINQENQGKGKAMNVALKEIKGEYFACLDADSFVASDALQVILPLFKEKRVAAVCPLLKVKKPINILQKVQWCEYIINMFYPDC